MARYQKKRLKYAVKMFKSTHMSRGHIVDKQDFRIHLAEALNCFPQAPVAMSSANDFSLQRESKLSIRVSNDNDKSSNQEDYKHLFKWLAIMGNLSFT